MPWCEHSGDAAADRDYFAAHAIAALRVLASRTWDVGLATAQRDTATAELATVTTALRGLVDALPRCQGVVYACDRPAMHAGRYCDKCAHEQDGEDEGGDIFELPQAPAIRTALAALGAGERGGTGNDAR